ncbi:hypothetical protein HDK77DRAFT_132398 [Phyllosticta capitalensis]|uniref:Uncharacterized protein n=2 Tax=Phyllosticta capitalensis TaxID=121624 RepID=A0ABR1Z1U0_9PEZI
MGSPAAEFQQMTNNLQMAFANLGKAMSLLAIYPTSLVGLLLIAITFWSQGRPYTWNLGLTFIIQHAIIDCFDLQTKVPDTRKGFPTVIPRISLCDAILVWSLSILAVGICTYVSTCCSNIWARLCDDFRPPGPFSWFFALVLLGFANSIMTKPLPAEFQDLQKSPENQLNLLARTSIISMYFLAWVNLACMLEVISTKLALAVQDDDFIPREFIIDTLEILAPLSLVLAHVIKLQSYRPRCFYILEWIYTSIQFGLLREVPDEKLAVSSFLEAIICLWDIRGAPTLRQVILIFGNLLTVAFSLADYLYDLLY